MGSTNTHTYTHAHAQVHAHTCLFRWLVNNLQDLVDHWQPSKTDYILGQGFMWTQTYPALPTIPVGLYNAAGTTVPW